jgi:PAS domain S-box-containing protein
LTGERLDEAAWLAAIVESSNDAIISTDLEGVITSWNPAAERLYGYAADDIIGKPNDLIIPPECHAEEVAVRQRIAAGQPVEHYESVRIRKDGLHIDVAMTVSPLRGAGDRIIGISKISHDISAHKRAAAAQRRVEEQLLQARDQALTTARRLAAIVQSSDDGIIGMNLDGVITAWNESAEELYGYTAEEALGCSIRLVVPKDRQEEESEVLRRIAQGERIEHFETIRCRKDGRRIPVSLSVSPVRDESGRVIGAAKITRDITERKRSAERAAFLAEVGGVLAGSLDYATTLKTVANMAVPVIADWCAVDVLDDDGKIERLAVAHRDPAKIELARTIRERYEDAESAFSAEHVVRTGAPVIVKEITDDMIVAGARGDQERVGFIRSLGLRSYMIVPLTAHGRTLGTLTLATAESGRIYTDEDFRLAQDVAFRAALAVDNAGAYAAAQAANRLKDEFLATLSHELRTPLNAILGYARMLHSGMLPPDKHLHAIQTVERNATSLRQIVEDILDVSRIVSGKIRLNIQPVDLPRVVSEAVETVLPAAAAKQIRVQTILDPRAAPISGDPDRLRQVVWNLVSNAVKFTPKQGVIQVRLARVNSHVEIAVSDNGAGISPDFLPHIFERFRQADSGTTREHAGIGLGLAIVRHLVELHGGTIHAASGGRDAGSTFRVRLPVMSVHQQTPAERRIHPTAEAGGHVSELPDLTGLSVLAVDDDADGRNLVGETLASRGAHVTAVDSVEEALKALERIRPDVMIADIGMARVDGYEFISRVRRSRDDAIREIPAAALTAYARAEDRMKALRSGFQIHLAKPVDPAELIIAVAALAKRTFTAD